VSESRLGSGYQIGLLRTQCHSSFVDPAANNPFVPAAGDEVVQLYISGEVEQDAPIRSLRGFDRIHLGAGESREVRFILPPEELPKDNVEISVGGGQPVGGTARVKGVMWRLPGLTWRAFPT